MRGLDKLISMKESQPCSCDDPTNRAKKESGRNPLLRKGGLSNALLLHGESYGRRIGLGRGRGVGVARGTAVAVGVAVAVAVGVAVAVAVAVTVGVAVAVAVAVGVG